MSERATPETCQLWDCDQYKVDDDYAEYNAYRRMADHAKQMERERDEAREQWRLSSVCRELTEQRDRLAESCRLLMKIVGPIENPSWATDDEIDFAYNSAEKALNPTLKEQSND